MKNRKLGNNGRLRIAMICAHSCPVGKLGAKDTGGMSVYVRELARELARCGHAVDVYTRVHDPNDAQIIPLGDDARLIHLRAGEDSVIDKLDVFPHLPEFTRQLESFRKQNNLHYDLIYSHYWLSGWVGKQLQRRWDVPHLIMFHTLGALKNAIGIGEGEPWIRVETEKYLARSCHRVIVATEKEKRDIAFYYGTPEASIAVIPCGVNLELFRPYQKEKARQQLGLDGKDRTILFVGRIDPLKGIDKLLAALALIGIRDRLRLFIIGGDENSRREIERLKKLSRDLRIQELVTFLGLIKQTELPVYYNAADLCVVPSYYESFGLVALESLACGTPVVTTRVGGAESIIRQGDMGYVVDSNNPAQLAQKMELLLTRPEDNGRQAGAMRALAEKFSWSNVARKLTRECRAVRKSYFA
ncbi:MAG: glycosyltransferase [Chloroflexi bacterium]|nr:glycosyltransferase [Chloroflexota bacterium]